MIPVGDAMSCLNVRLGVECASICNHCKCLSQTNEDKEMIHYTEESWQQDRQ